jgi:hypothetical protein
MQAKVIKILLLLSISALLFYILVVPKQLEKKTFTEHYGEMSLIWKVKGIDTHVHKDFNNLLRLSERELKDMRKKVLEFGSNTDNNAISELSKLYARMFELAMESKRIDELVGKLSHNPNKVCEEIDTYKELVSTTEHLISNSRTYAYKLDKFTKQFPNESDEIALLSEEPDLDVASGRLAEYKSTIKELEKYCKGGS